MSSIKKSSLDSLNERVASGFEQISMNFLWHVANDGKKDG